MTSRWEEKYGKEERADEPVTITERQLASLKRGATVGVIAAILAVIAVGLAGWSLVSARNMSSEPTVAMAPEGATPAANPAPAAAPTPPAAQTTAPAVGATGATAPAAPTTAPAAQAAKPTPQVAESPKPARVKSSRAARPHAAAGGSTEKPMTMPATSLEPVSPSASSPNAIAKPQPVAPVPATPKPAARDTTSH